MLIPVKVILIISLIAILVILIFMPINETPKQVSDGSFNDKKAIITGAHILIQNLEHDPIDMKELCGHFLCANLPSKEEFEELQKEAKARNAMWEA